MDKFIFKSVSDERLVIDVLVPGFGKDAVNVKTAQVNGGEAFKVVVEGHYIAHKNKAGEKIPKLGFEKYVSDFKYVFSDDVDFGDEVLFRSRTFTSKDYNLDKLTWSVADGVVRISIPKTDLARGKAIKAVDNADAESTGVPDTDAVAD